MSRYSVPRIINPTKLNLERTVAALAAGQTLHEVAGEFFVVGPMAKGLGYITGPHVH